MQPISDFLPFVHDYFGHINLDFFFRGRPIA